MGDTAFGATKRVSWVIQGGFSGFALLGMGRRIFSPVVLSYLGLRQRQAYKAILLFFKGDNL